MKRKVWQGGYRLANTTTGVYREEKRWNAKWEQKSRFGNAMTGDTAFGSAKTVGYSFFELLFYFCFACLLCNIVIPKTLFLSLFSLSFF